MLTLDFLHPGLMLFVRAFVCFGSTLLLYNDLYFPTGWAGETMSVLGRARFGFLLSAPRPFTFRPFHAAEVRGSTEFDPFGTGLPASGFFRVFTKFHEIWFSSVDIK